MWVKVFLKISWYKHKNVEKKDDVIIKTVKFLTKLAFQGLKVVLDCENKLI